MAFLCVAARAQTSERAGTIDGWISDSFGAPLPGVSVDASCASAAAHRSAVTVKDGTYRLSSLPPGRCVIRISRPGFASVEKAVTVVADEVSTIPLILQLAVREKVLVSGDTPFVDTTSTTAARGYGNALIIHLPVDRNYADIARVHPGVVTDNGSSQGRSISLATNGSTSAESQWTIDGISTTNVMMGVQGKAFNNEAIETVEVATGGFPAEYGRSLGGVINVVTKSGGNAFHGGAFVYYDSSGTRAGRAYVAGEDSPLSGMKLAHYERADYGVDLGGFVVKDRLWFFGAYNRTDFPGAVSRIASSKLVLASMQFPLEGTDELYSLKVTGNLSAGTTLVGTVFSDPTTNSGAGAADPRRSSATFRTIDNTDPGTWQATRTIGATDYGLRLGQVLGAAGFFGFQAARHQDRFRLDPTAAGLAVRIGDYTCSSGVGTETEPCAMPTEENFSTGGFGNLGGPGNNSRSHRDQFRADGNFFFGTHELKLGADYQDAWTIADAHFSGGQLVLRFNERGTVYYFHNFYTEGPTSLTPVAAGVYRGGSREIGAYIQDAWKAAPGLTINAGLRLDEEDLRDYRDVTVMSLGNEWQPRLGIAWDPWGDGATNVHVFAGRFYYSQPTWTAARLFGGVSKGRAYNYDPVDMTPAEVPGEASHVGAPGIADLVDDGVRGISLDELTVGVERLIGPSFSVGLTATYRNLRNVIEDRCDIDYNAPGNPMLGGAYCVLINPGGSGKYARGDFYSCTAWTLRRQQLPSGSERRRDGSSMERQRRRPQSGSTKGSSSSRARALGDRLWLQASYVYSTLRGNYDGEVNEGYEPDEPGREHRLRLSAAPAEFLRTPLSSTGRSTFASPATIGRRSSSRLASTPTCSRARRSTGGDTSTAASITSGSCRGARPDACRRSGKRI